MREKHVTCSVLNYKGLMQKLLNYLFREFYAQRIRKISGLKTNPDQTKSIWTSRADSLNLNNTAL